MYSSEKNPGIVWKDLIVKVIFFVIFILILMWLFPKVPNMTAFYSNVFRENISYMQDAAKSYYTNERLPKNVGDMAEMTLQDMIDKNLIIPFVDKDGNPCDTYESYVQVTKESTEEYSLKVNLVCDTESSYIIEPLGCYDYCESGKCEIPEESETAIEYQFRQAYTTDKTKYVCPTGYTLSGTTCYKNLADSKIEATANYKTIDVVVDALKNTTGSYPVYADPIVDADSSYTCPSGYDRDGDKCYKSISATAESETVSYTCPSGYTKNGTKCTKTETISATVSGGQTTYTCPSGYRKNGTKCTKTETISATVSGGQTTYTCPSGYRKNGTKCTKTTTTTTSATKTTDKVYKYGTFQSAPSGYICSTSTQYVCTSSSNCPGYITVYTSCYKNQTTYTCPSGYTKSGTKCTKSTTSTINATANTSATTYTCPSGYTQSGSICQRTQTISATASTSTTTYTCPSGYTKNGTQCTKTITIDAEKNSSGINYTCPSGYTLEGKRCYTYTNADLKYDYTYTCPSGYTQSGSGSNIECYKNVQGTTKYYCENSGYSLIGTKCYGTQKTFTGYTCPSGYTLDGSSCFKKNTTTVSATKKTEKVTGYNYKWSKSETLEGWERTGKTRTVEI